MRSCEPQAAQPHRPCRRAIAWANQNQPSANGTKKLTVIASARVRSSARLIVTLAPTAKARNGGGSETGGGPPASREGRSRTHSSVFELVPASRRFVLVGDERDALAGEPVENERRALARAPPGRRHRERDRFLAHAAFLFLELKTSCARASISRAASLAGAASITESPLAALSA